MLVSTNKKADTIGIQRIIYGKIKNVTNPVTGITTTVGDGKVVWDIADERKGFFMIRLRKTR